MATKYEVEKFDGQNSFSLWRVKMRTLLTQQGLYKTVLGKDKLSATMKEDEREELDIKALSAIKLCLSNEVLREVADEMTTAELWLRLESLYMTKSFTNRLYLKQ